MLREFLKCGLLEHGFARLWCSECRRSVLVAFSCRGRSFCPSCEKKNQLLWATIEDDMKEFLEIYCSDCARYQPLIQERLSEVVPAPEGT